jgi:hypothetical protein
VKACSSIQPFIASNSSYTGNYTTGFYTPPTQITWNIYMADDDLNMCLSACPASSTISIRYGALFTLLSTPIYYDLRNKRCVAECPSTEPYSWSENMTCYLVCPKGAGDIQFYIYDGDKSCVSTCPST